MLRVQTAYNRGNMAGALTSAVSSIQSAVLLAHSKSRNTTPALAFQEVCDEISAVFAGILGITRFDPEPDYSSDAPSDEFADSMIKHAGSRLAECIRQVTHMYHVNDIQRDANPCIMRENHRFFGRNVPEP